MNMQSSHLKELISGEMAAVRSFDTVISKIKDTTEIQRLNSIREDHVRAVDVLKGYAGPDVKMDADNSSAWSSFAQAFTSGASLFGDKAAVKALKMGEEHGIREYREALEDKDLAPDVKQVIQSELLPKQEGHIGLIDSFTLH